MRTLYMVTSKASVFPHRFEFVALTSKIKGEHSDKQRRTASCLPRGLRIYDDDPRPGPFNIRPCGGRGRDVFFHGSGTFRSCKVRPGEFDSNERGGRIRLWPRRASGISSKLF